MIGSANAHKIGSVKIKTSIKYTQTMKKYSHKECSLKVAIEHTKQPEWIIGENCSQIGPLSPCEAMITRYLIEPKRSVIYGQAYT